MLRGSSARTVEAAVEEIDGQPPESTIREELKREEREAVRGVP